MQARATRRMTEQARARIKSGMWVPTLVPTLVPSLVAASLTLYRSAVYNMLSIYTNTLVLTVTRQWPLDLPVVGVLCTSPPARYVKWLMVV